MFFIDMMSLAAGMPVADTLIKSFVYRLSDLFTFNIYIKCGVFGTCLIIFSSHSINHGLYISGLPWWLRG